MKWWLPWTQGNDGLTWWERRKYARAYRRKMQALDDNLKERYEMWKERTRNGL